MGHLKRVFSFLLQKIPRVRDEPDVQVQRDERWARLREQQRRALMLGVELDALRRSNDD